MKTGTVQVISAMIALAHGIPAFAQQGETGGTPGSRPAPAAEAADDDGVSDILVTARRFEESLQSTPVAVSAITAEGFERFQATGLADLSSIVPNLNITANQSTPSSAQIYLRGIGQDDSTPTFEPGVGVYVDGVYFARLQGSLLDLGDFERVEVLRGPQGTLYGRNSSGGAISFVTRKPHLFDTQVWADATYGTFSRLDLRGSISVPIVEGKVAAKLEFMSRDRDGYITRVSDGQDLNRLDRQVGRLSLRVQLSENATLDLAGDYTRDRSGLQVPVPLGVTTPTSPLPRLPGNRSPLFGYYRSASDAPDVNRLESGGVSGVFNLDLGPVSIRSISAWRELSNRFYGDLRGRSAALGGRSVLFRDLDQNQITQELQLLSNGDGPLRYVVGVFLLRERLSNRDTLARQTNYTLNSTSYAIYGEATYELFDGFSATAGGRYTIDKKRIRVNAISGGGLAFQAAASPDFKEFTPKLGLSYQFNEGPLVYGTYSKGFKAGAFPGFPQRREDVTSAILPPEKVDSFEVGVKADWFDRRLRTNIAAFTSDYSGLQLTLRNPATSILEGASAAAKIKGIEFEMEARPFKALTLSGSYSLLDAEYTKSTAAAGAIGLNRGYIKFAPRHQWYIGGVYAIDLGGGELNIASNYVWRGKTYLSGALTESASQDSYGLLDASVRYESRNRWYLAAGVQNATDEKYATTGSDGVVSGAPITQLFVALPRTYSVSVGYRF